ncbi:MAG: hypothetical protein M3R46_11285, partial [Actinomycetota bacterium]|nr:hypothetical protein [Actinomycetota bacterium]
MTPTPGDHQGQRLPDDVHFIAAAQQPTLTQQHVGARAPTASRPPRDQRDLARPAAKHPPPRPSPRPQNPTAP